MQGEVHEQRQQRERDHDRHRNRVAGQEAEGDAAVARVHQREAGQHAAFFALDDRGPHGVLGELVEDDDGEGNERGAGPGGADQPWMMPCTTMLLTSSSTISATNGLKSRPPKDGRTRRKIRRNGSHTSRRKPITAPTPRE